MDVSKTVCLITSILCSIHAYQLSAAEAAPPQEPAEQNDAMALYHEIVIQILLILHDLPTPLEEDNGPSITQLQHDAQVILEQIQKRRAEMMANLPLFFSMSIIYCDASSFLNRDFSDEKIFLLCTFRPWHTNSA